ncbi:DUF916 domain-containing protein [Streptomyces roseolus]|uniref:DUF916 domain-containing protein n=1 Tax=Streptomyces roseolus TaxID=67358 RepID=UPI001678D5F7|nr:DUF916 domain-containing protein [Streptomyces roseolus]GGR30846.1 hypothetical protein GCM10010282_24050 [Streptomyces roseolus]
MRRKLYALLLSAALPLLGAPAAHAAENGERAVHLAAARLGERPYYVLTADPGATLRDKVTVANRTAAPLTFRIYGADAYNTERDGGFAVRTLKEEQTGAGAWIEPERTTATVPPRSAVTVPFTLTVPADADPGDQPGPLVALDERIAPAGGGVAMGVQRAVAARVHLKVSGPAVPALAVEDVTLEQDRPLVDRVPAELLPRQKIRLTERWTGSPQLDRGEVTLTATAKDVRESAAVSFLAMPWLAAAALAAGAAGGLAGWRIRRRRARRGH